MSNDLSVREHDNTATSISAGSDARRAIAEVQAALTVAAARPRNEMACIERVKIACQRPRLAERAEYSFARGGTDITGASIDLLTEIARHWGNITFGFRELSQRNGESEVEAYAWDLESNSKRSVVFTVPHIRQTKTSRTVLVDPRDIYELVANNAQRRVRACLEAVIPSDVVDEALDQVHETLKSSANVTPESVKGLVDAFAKLGVTRQQIEARIQRRIDGITPAQVIGMRRIYKSLQDGMSEIKDWFAAEPVEVPQQGSKADQLAASLSAKAANDRSASVASAPADSSSDAARQPTQTAVPPQPVVSPDKLMDEIASARMPRRLTQLAADVKAAFASGAIAPEDRDLLEGAIAARLTEISPKGGA